jgi:flagellar biosynthetic protein FlhB
VPEESLQEKTERATPRKRQKAREEGQVARSVELPSVIVLLTGIVLLRMISPMLGRQADELLRSSLSFNDIPNFTLEYCMQLMEQMAKRYLLMVLPVMGAVLISALAINFYQVGLHFSFKPLEPKLERFNVFKGMKRFFSKKAFVELIKSIVKLAIIGWVAYRVIDSESGHLLHLHDLECAAITVFILKGIFKLFLWVLLVMAVLAVLDHAFQKWQFEEQLKMTKQEIKEEYKQTEGDPQVKARIKSIQIQAARRRMMQQVPQADVVVTNPTHLALAIRYAAEKMTAPQVVAKGAGRVAERIKTVAAEHSIPVVENKELARNLYKLVKIGEEIPVQLYQAVAELLAYVYKLKGKIPR